MKLIIYDFDGTVLNTEDAEFKAWQYVYEQYSQNLTLQIWQTRFANEGADHGFNPFLNLKYLTGQELNLETVTSIRRAKLKKLLSTLKPLPGIVESLGICRKLNIACAIASSSPRYWIEDLLNRFNLIGYFDLILSKDEIKAIKPNPDIYLEVLKRFNIKPQEAVAIEDSPIGAKAAVAAGIDCIVVPHALTEALSFPQEVYIAKTDLTEIDFQSLIKKKQFIFH